MVEPASASVSSPLRESPLAALWRGWGGRIGPVAGWGEVGLELTSLAEEHGALRTGAALVDLAPLEVLAMAGVDRHRFLGGQVTCEVKDLAPGGLRYGFFANRQGKVEADVTVLARDDRFWLVLPPGRGEEVRQRLEKFIIADRVELSSVHDRVALALAGPGAEAKAAELGLELGENAVAAGRLGAQDVLAARAVRWGLPVVELWLDAGQAPALAAELVAAGVPAVGFAALETLRVERGEPRFGADFGADHFPQETGLEERAVSYTKGCYLGQEVIARIHYRGQANRQLCGLVFDGAVPPAHGAQLLADGRPAGSVGTAVTSPALGATAGLAILHRRAAAPGTELKLDGGGTAEVRSLPLVDESTS